MNSKMLFINNDNNNNEKDAILYFTSSFTSWVAGISWSTLDLMVNPS